MKVRELALDALVKIEQQGAYSNLLLRQVLDKQSLDARDSALLTEIVYGTVQRQLTIDYVLNRLIERGISPFSPWLRACLRLSLYQMLFLDRIPDHAIVNTAVQIAKKRGHLGIAKLVNGVLRNAIRRKTEWLNASIHKDVVDRISYIYSYPQWLVTLWLSQYGEAVTEQICAAQLRPAKTSVRVNRMKTNRDDLLRQMQQRSLNAVASVLSKDGIVIERGGNIADSDWFRNGLCTIQDESSMMVAQALDARPGMKILDCCAAPGGKTTHIAETISDRGEIVAVDVHPHKKNLIIEQTKRLRLTCVETVTADAAKLRERFKEQTFDRILLDAPCSGFGVIRRKPDLKWRKSETDIREIVNLQQALLESVAPLLKSGGILVYSTCTLNRAENEQIINWFLRKHPHFLASPDFPSSFPEPLRSNVDKALGSIKILPHEYDSDGFFIARLRRM
jgi:16S rRNA (cytosine967-C5)-methyltransferase